MVTASTSLAFNALGIKPLIERPPQAKKVIPTKSASRFEYFEHRWVFDHLLISFLPEMRGLNYRDLRDYLDSLPAKYHSLWFDMNGAKWLDITGARVLTLMAKDVVHTGRECVFITTSEPVRRLLRLSGVNQIAHIVDSLPEAVGVLGKLPEGDWTETIKAPKTFCQRVALAKQSMQLA